MRTLSGVCGDREGVSLQRPGLAPRLSSSSLCLDTLCVMTTGAVVMNMDLSQPGFKCPLSQLCAVSPWANYLMSLCSMCPARKRRGT